MDLSSVFVSYRHGTDGDRLVARVAALLRCGGLRPWIDHVDMGAGAIDQRIQDALQRAAGGVLIVTDDLVDSAYVRDKELPLMVQQVAQQRLPMMVVNSYRDPVTGDLDISKPDEILESATDIPLVDITQADVESVEGQRQFMYGFLRRRTEQWRQTKTTHLDLRILTDPGDSDPHADLELSFEESDAGIPNEEYRKALAISLPELTRACKRAGISSLEVTGGARLSVALTLGAMFSRQASIDRLTISSYGKLWGSPEESDPGVHDVVPKPLPDGDGSGLAIYVSLIKEGGESTGNDHAFGQLLEELRPRRSVRIDLTGDGWIHPGEGSRLAQQVGRIVKSLADEANTSEVHLCLMGPFPMAVLIGRQLNRLQTTVYEYLDLEHRYLPMFRLRPSAPRPITALAGGTHDFEELRNLTPHNVTLLSDGGEVIATWPATDSWARLAEISSDQPVRIGAQAIPSTVIRYGAPLNLPPLSEGVGLIVPRVLAEKVRRADLLFPGGEVRDEDGAIIGCRRLDSYKEQE